VTESARTERAVAWAAEQWGREVRRVDRLHGGWTSTMLRLTDADGDRAVLRLMTREPWRRHARELLAREAVVQALLAGSAVPVPVSLAIDLDGSSGDPAHLMSWLPGRLELTRCDDDLLTRLAALLARIHAVDPGERRPRAYQSWAQPAKRMVPDWARRPSTWTAAFDVLAAPLPSYDARFLHRDFHLGNVLWADGEVSGVVDWVETSWGPSTLDVAHAATYLAMLHGPDAAAGFVAAHQRITGAPPASDDDRYWHVLDLVGYLPDPGKVVQPWRDQGIEIDDVTVRARLEQRLVDVLAS
jgi:aminoglycoside phosphotransferase (APT) family kinase protein